MVEPLRGLIVSGELPDTLQGEVTGPPRRFRAQVPVRGFYLTTDMFPWCRGDPLSTGYSDFHHNMVVNAYREQLVSAIQAGLTPGSHVAVIDEPAARITRYGPMEYQRHGRARRSIDGYVFVGVDVFALKAS
jgi:hypothetical protein